MLLVVESFECVHVCFNDNVCIMIGGLQSYLIG